MFTDKMKSMIVEYSNLYKDKVMDPATPSYVTGNWPSKVLSDAKPLTIDKLQVHCIENRLWY